MDRSAVQVAFQGLCSNVADAVETNENRSSSALDEKIGKALFKLDESFAIVSSMKSKAEVIRDEVVPGLIAHLHKVKQTFEIIDHLEKLILSMSQATDIIEERYEVIKKKSDLLFPISGVTKLLKQFNLQQSKENFMRPFTNTHPLREQLEWTPIDLSFNTLNYFQENNVSSKKTNQ